MFSASASDQGNETHMVHDASSHGWEDSYAKNQEKPEEEAQVSEG